MALQLAAFLLMLCVTSKSLAAETGLSGNKIVADLTELSVEQLLDVEVETVYSASKHEQKITDAPALVNIITSDDIKKFGYRTLADALRSVPGFFITYDRNYNFIGTHGFNRPGDYNSRVLLMLDGHRINDNIYDTAPIGTEFPVDIDLVDRIEIVHGPGSSLYGANAFFGVINVITRKGSDLDGVEFSGAGGSFNTYNGRVSYGKELDNGLDMVLSASMLNSSGQDLYYKEFDTPAQNNGIAANADRDKNYQFFAKLKYSDFTLTGVYGTREKGIPTAAYDTVFNTTRTRTTDEHAFLDLKYVHQFSGNTDVMARVYLDRSHYRGDYLYAPATMNKDIGLGSWWGSELQASRTFLERLRVTAGTEYRNNFQLQQRNYDEGAVPKLDDSRHSNIWAIYLQNELKIFDSLSLNAGVRYDHYDTSGGSTNPRLALIYKPFDKTAFKLLYGEAFRAPNAYELYYSDSNSTQKGNPSLRAEKIRTYRLVYEQYLGENLRSTVSGFYYKIDDLITGVTDISDGLLQYRNVNKVDTRGLMLELEGKWAYGLLTRFNYTFQNAKDLSTGSTLTNSPQHLAKANLSVPLFGEKLFASIEEQFTGRRTTVAGNSTSAFFITNMTFFSRNLLPRLELSATIYNLFDKRYGDPSSGPPVNQQDIIMQDGRAFRAKLTYSF